MGSIAKGIPNKGSGEGKSKRGARKAKRAAKRESRKSEANPSGRTNAGKFLRNFARAATGETKGYDQYHSAVPSGPEVAANNYSEGVEDSADTVKKAAGFDYSSTPLFRGGGIGPMDLGGEDATDISSNMTKAYMKKKGY